MSSSLDPPPPVSDAAPRFLFTVFTPTYNRAHTLDRAYRSLASQTMRDFEWLIVDDGSTDHTSDLVARWRSEADFAIRYLQQANGGKHVAFNRGVREAQGELFLTLDSDDGCVPTALERFDALWRDIPDTERTSFSAVTSLVADPQGNIVGDRFPTESFDSSSLEMYFRHGIAGEKWGFQRTSVLRAFPFPEPIGVSFVPESIVWFRIARSWRTRYVNEALRIYFPTGSTGQALSQLTPGTARGRLLMHQEIIEEYRDYLTVSPLVFARSLINYVRYSWLIGDGPVRQLRRLKAGTSRAMIVPFLVPGGLVAARDRHRARSASAR